VEEIRTEAGAEFDNDVIDPGKTFFQPLVYATILYSMDKVVGDILVKLEEHSLSENTIIFFCSDNGANADGLNAPFRGFKKSMWEGGIHVPAAIWWPGRVDAHLASYAGNGGIYSGFAQYLDFYPTMMSLADLPIAGTGLDGIDLKNVLINNLEARGGYDDPYYGVDIKKGGLRSDSGNCITMRYLATALLNCMTWRVISLKAIMWHRQTARSWIPWSPVQKMGE
jgi:hypothetical protein